MKSAPFGRGGQQKLEPKKGRKSRVKAETSNKKPAKKDGDIFEAKKEEYKPSEQRKTDQVLVVAKFDFIHFVFNLSSFVKWFLIQTTI